MFWDDGSNRVLVNNSFAKENQLKEVDASVVMKTAGGGRTKLDSKIYELDLKDKFGKLHHIWGYGVDEIVEEEEPIDPKPIMKLFPHVPKAAFDKLE